MAAFFSYLWDSHRQFTIKLFHKFPEFDAKFSNWVGVGTPYSYGDVIDGYEGHLLFVVLKVIEDEPLLPFDTDDLCCTRFGPHLEGRTDIPEVYSVWSLVERISQEKYEKKFDDLDEFQKIAVEAIFEHDYEYLMSFTEGEIL